VRPHIEGLYRTGQVIVGGEVKVSDGSSIGARERIGSAFLADAKDMDDAIRVASLHSTSQASAGEQLDWRIEIRPVHYFERPARASPMPE
jgi:hypothetical protein